MPVRFMTAAAFAGVLLIGFSLAGCVTIDQSEQMDTRRELSALNVMYSGLLKKVTRIDNNTSAMLDDVEEAKTGFASLEVETRSTLAENNAELEKFREEFGFIRGGIEETVYFNKELTDVISELKNSQGRLTERLAIIEQASVTAGKKEVMTGAQIQEALQIIETKIGDVDAKIDNLNKLSATLERRISMFEEKKTPKKKKIKGAGKNPEELFEKGYHNAVKKNYSKAIEDLKGFLSANPKHKLAVRAQYWLAESYYGRDDFEKAILEFNKVIKKYPKSKLVSVATYMQGLSFFRLGSNKEARVIFERVIKKFPDSKVAGDAKKRLKKMDPQKK